MVTALPAQERAVSDVSFSTKEIGYPSRPIHDHCSSKDDCISQRPKESKIKRKQESQKHTLDR